MKLRRAGEDDPSPESWAESGLAPTVDAAGHGPRTATIVLTNWRLTEEQKQEAVELYESGQSCGQVATRFGVTRQSMWDVLRRRTEMRPRERNGEDNHFWRGGTRAVDAAQNKLEKAIQRGEIVRPARCQACFEICTPDAHHPDYGKPLEVMWLCRKCHHAWHKTNTAKGVMPLEATQDESISSAEASRERVRTSPSPDSAGGSPGTARASSSSSPASPSLFDPAPYSWRTSPDCSLPAGATLAERVGVFYRSIAEPTSLWSAPALLNSGTAWHGGFSTAVTSECPSVGGACSSSASTLADVLEPSAPAKYSLSARAASGILRRAEKRGRELPPALRTALETVAS